MRDFLRHFGTEAQCVEAFARWRWPDGFRCSKCGHDQFHRLVYRSLRQCQRCRRQNSVVAGTVLHNTKMPLTTWFLGLYLIESQDEKGISTRSLAVRLGISLHAAYRMRKKLAMLMNDPERPLRLASLVQDVHRG